MDAHSSNMCVTGPNLQQGQAWLNQEMNDHVWSALDFSFSGGGSHCSFSLGQSLCYWGQAKAESDTQLGVSEIDILCLWASRDVSVLIC